MTDATAATIFLLLLCGSALLSIVFWSVKLGITPTPTGRKVRNTVADILPGKVRGEIVELGCGWGSLLPMLAQRYPDQKIIGFEHSPLPWLVAHLRTLGYRNIEVRRQDFFQTNLSTAGLVFGYLYPGAMTRLSRHLRNQLSDGAVIISHTFHLPGWQEVTEIRANDLYQTPVFLYQVSQSDIRGWCPQRSLSSGKSPAVPENS